MVISIIVVNFNCSQLANRCLKSIFNDEVEARKEIIFVDNASQDISLLDQKLLSQVDVKIFNDRNLGVGAARNLGLTKASGKYVCFLDSDDIFLQGKLKNQLEFLEENNSFFMVCTNYYRVDSFDNLSRKTGLSLDAGEIKYSNLIQTNSIALSSVMCRNKAGILNFDKGIREDYKLWLSILNSEYRIYYIDNPLIGYYLPNKLSFVRKKIPKLGEQWRVQRSNSSNIITALYRFLIYCINAIKKLWRT